MNTDEAREVLAVLDDHDPNARERTETDYDRRAAAFARTLPEAPDGWATAWLFKQLRLADVPSLIHFVKAWHAELQDRSIGLRMPEPPGELACKEPIFAYLWERSFRDEFQRTRSHADAWAATNVAFDVGPIPYPAEDETSTAA